MSRKADRPAAGYAVFGERLKKVRRLLGMEFIDMANAAGMARDTLSRYERGVKFPNLKYLRYLNSRHNVSLDYIMSGRGEPFLRDVDVLEHQAHFKKNREEVDELFFCMSNFPHALYKMLGSFVEYKLTMPRENAYGDRW